MEAAKLNRRSFLSGLGSLLATASLARLGIPADDRTLSQPGKRTGGFGDIDESVICDVCIIGSGFAGAVLGQELVRHGIKTVILESGVDPRGNVADPRFQELDSYRSSGPLTYPVISSRFRGVGGTSWLWGGMCLRLLPIDFEKNPYTPAGAAWPITYKELQPYYEQAELTLRVRGGKRSQYHPPRGADYSIAPDRDVSPLQSMLQDVGIVISDIPYSTAIGREQSFLSDRLGPFVRMTDSHLPEFQKSDVGSLIAGVTATRLHVDESGAISGVEVRDLDRNTKNLRARVYVVACGGLESPRLLLLSRSSRFPHGIGNNHDLVGRFFMEHRPARFYGRVRLGWKTFSMVQLKGQSYQFYHNFKAAGLGGMTLGFDMEGSVDGQQIWSGKIGDSLRRIYWRNLEIGIGAEMKPSADNRVTLDAKARDYFGNPGVNLFLAESEEEQRTLARAKKIVLETYSKLGVKEIEEVPRNFWGHHHIGTCRMGDNPRTSVVDRHLRVHGTTNLFVSGSSVFVTSGTANPTLTLTALSIRLGEYLRARLQDGAFPPLHSKTNRHQTGKAI
jgi:choline dehydrogenase-like flavoprotein